MTRQPPRIVLIVTTLAAALFAAAFSACELGPFHCEGEIPGQGPLCYCDVDGNLCGHDGFPSCGECPLP
jgi:hypothetical protein